MDRHIPLKFFLKNPRKQLIRDRRATRRRALRSGAPEHRRIANQLSRRVRAALDEHRQETWRRFVESLNPRDNSLWKTQKALKTRRRPVPPLHGEQGIVRDKAEAFADSLTAWNCSVARISSTTRTRNTPPAP
ncbi:hypothetical protein NQ315_016233 [Exocentrus adspersus]|uniref:Reverse transcriptase n=1 Tax=Exocentrus adspersus TaxID=1586481 RepID=A0AAV8VIY2_9CUCU|nr:hypothetical protein NQ315_016233 [Exocentrus adspersus]